MKYIRLYSKVYSNTKTAAHKTADNYNVHSEAFKLNYSTCGYGR